MLFELTVGVLLFVSIIVAIGNLIVINDYITLAKGVEKFHRTAVESLNKRHETEEKYEKLLKEYISYKKKKQ